MNFKKFLSGFRYELPTSAIALTPAQPRDRSQLLAYDRRNRTVRFARFYKLPKLLPPGALLVFNETKVVPARLPAARASGGRTELLVTGRSGKRILALSPKRLKEGEVLKLPDGKKLTVKGREGGVYELAASFPMAGFPRLLNRHGSTPLPPYLKSSPLGERERRRRYQSVFARAGESAAAPTASLHFTPRLLRELRRAGFQAAFVQLDVSLGTFAPLTEDQVARGRLHAERYRISAAAARAINAAQRAGRPVVPVGTTALRCLESAASSRGVVKPGPGATDIFIRPGYRFKVATGLVTNFHVPGSSLMLLVAALLGKTQLRKLYRLALSKKFRFLSFGDAMLIM